MTEMERREYLQSVGGLALTPALSLTDARTGADGDEQIRVWEGHYRGIQIIYVQIPEQVDADEISVQTEETSSTHATDDLYQSRKSQGRDDTIYSFIHQSRTERVEVDGKVQSIGGFGSLDAGPSHREIVFSQQVGSLTYYSLRLAEKDSDRILSRSHSFPDDAEELLFELKEEGVGWVEYTHNIVERESEINSSTISFQQVIPTDTHLTPDDYRSADGLRTTLVRSDGSTEQIPLFFGDAEESEESA